MMRRLITVVIAVLLCVTNSYAQKEVCDVSRYIKLSRIEQGQ